MTRKYKHEYYLKHKDNIYAKQQEYFAKNRKKITKMMNDYRKRCAIQYKNEGQMYYWLPKTERQNKMINLVCRKKRLSVEDAKALLESVNWNVISLIDNFKVVNLEGETIFRGTKREIATHLNKNINSIDRTIREKSKTKYNEKWYYIMEVEL